MTNGKALIMSNKNIKLGKFGENIAAEYLQSKNYNIITANYYTREGEIDLVCQKDNRLIFDEVKTRTNKNFGWPEEAVTDEKLEKLVMAGEKYLQEHDLDLAWQIDVISIIINKNTRTAQIKHFQNID